ncbi:MAG: L,D-transpeptidase, partial [Gammaproteobacteria bacterium]
MDIDISEQRLYLYEDYQLIKSYPISSSYFGEGEIENSYKTPLGKHAIQQMIGQNSPKNTIFVNRESYSQIADIVSEAIDNEEDFITSRVMWLTGL